MSKKSRFFLLLLLVISFFVIIICILISNRKAKYFQLDFNAGEIVESEIVKERTEETPKTKPLNGNINIGKRPNNSTVCDASVIKDKNIEYTPLLDLKDEFQKASFVNEHTNILIYLSTDSDTLLYGEKGCYISTYGISMYNIHNNELVKTIRSGIFTEEKEEVGEIIFFMADGELLSNITWKSIKLDTRSDIISILEDNPDEKYIILTNGNYHMFLDEDNNITKGWPTIDDFEIIGDCYNALNSDVLGISYNDIIDDNNLVWIEFN